MPRHTATLITLAATLATTTPALAHRPATPAEHAAATKGRNRDYGDMCTHTITAITISTITPAYARIDTTPDPDTPGCEYPDTILALRMPGHAQYAPIWSRDTGAPRPCWLTGQKVMADLLPDLTRIRCQPVRAARQDPTHLTPSLAGDGGTQGVRNATPRQRSEIAHSLYGTRKRCYPALRIRIAKGNSAIATAATVAGRAPATTCPTNDSITLLLRIPGSGRWVPAWQNNGADWGAPCWLTGRRIMRSLFPWITICERRPAGATITLAP